MKKRNALIFIVHIVLFLLISGVFFWQYNLYKKFIARGYGESCGGDWSYAKVCERGSYCKTIKNAPLMGGTCTPYLNWLFGRFVKDTHTWEKSTHPYGWSVDDRPAD